MTTLISSASAVCFVGTFRKCCASPGRGVGCGGFALQEFRGSVDHTAPSLYVTLVMMPPKVAGGSVFVSVVLPTNGK